MKRSVYGMDIAAYEKMLKKRIGLSIGLAAFTLILNIVLLLLRNDSNHLWMLIGNIVTDGACGLFLVYYISMCILPQWKLLGLGKRQKEVFSGEITEIEAFTTRYGDFDCHCIHLGKRRTFLPSGTLRLEVGQQVELTLVSNIILEVAQ